MHILHHSTLWDEIIRRIFILLLVFTFFVILCSFRDTTLEWGKIPIASFFWGPKGVKLLQNIIFYSYYSTFLSMWPKGRRFEDKCALISFRDKNETFQFSTYMYVYILYKSETFQNLQKINLDVDLSIKASDLHNHFHIVAHMIQQVIRFYKIDRNIWRSFFHEL